MEGGPLSGTWTEALGGLWGRVWPMGIAEQAADSGHSTFGVTHVTLQSVWCINCGE